MSRLTQGLVLIVVAWAGAFAIAFAVAEWRDDDGANTDTVSGPTSNGTPTPEPEPNPTFAEPTPPVPVTVTMQDGETVEYDGIRITVDDFRNEEKRVFFLLENIGGPGGGHFTTSTMSSVDRFDCGTASVSDYGNPTVDTLGETARFWVQWDCGPSTPANLTLGSRIVYEFPSPSPPG
jgi:hypothetical protein